jgi:hypothetical protein
MAQVVEHLPGKQKALNSNLVLSKKKKKLPNNFSFFMCKMGDNKNNYTAVYS